MSTGPLRPGVAILAGLLACLLLPVAVIATWVATVITDTDRYVETVVPLAEDEAVLDAVEERVALVVVRILEPDQLEQDLRDLLDRETGEGRPDERLLALLDLLTEAVADAVIRVVHEILATPQFSAAWEQANRTAHAQLISILRDETAAGDGVTVDLAAIVDMVLQRLDEEGFINADEAPQVDASFRLADGEDLEQAQQYYRLLDRLKLWLPLSWLALVGITIGVARNRSRAVSWLAVGSILGVVVLAVALRLGREAVLDAAAPEDVAFVGAAWRVLFDGLRSTLRVMLIAGLVIAVVAWLFGRGSTATQLRRSARTVPAHARGFDLSVWTGVLLVAGVVAVLVWLI